MSSKRVPLDYSTVINGSIRGRKIDPGRKLLERLLKDKTMIPAWASINRRIVLKCEPDPSISIESAWLRVCNAIIYAYATGKRVPRPSSATSRCRLRARGAPGQRDLAMTERRPDTRNRTPELLAAKVMVYHLGTEFEHLLGTRLDEAVGDIATTALSLKRPLGATWVRDTFRNNRE